MKVSSHKTEWYKKYNDQCCLLGYRGSIAHGTYRPQEDPNSIDDKDIMGVLVYPKDYYLGLGAYRKKDMTITFFENEWDCVFYELRHFMALLIKSNPNVLSLLWMPDNLYLKTSIIGKELIANRELFSTKEAYYTFTGYAHSQLHKMTNYGAFQGHMGRKRKELVEKHGYDTKNASHLIRLLNMGIEFLTTGSLTVVRKDGPYLLDIKDGKYTLEQIQAEADRLFRLTEESFVRSNLPIKPNEKKVDELLVRLLKMEAGCQ